ncbi:MAG: DUF2975 domain-containing protein [Hespellia sp.]|nr:DUF2975 domain-containing protein [Hespellia sp.]
MKKVNIIKITKIILDIMLILGIVTVLTLPLTMSLAGTYYSTSIAEHYTAMVFIFGVSALFGLMILYELRKMMKSVLEENCFILRNVTSLDRMGGFSICISVMFILKMFIVPTPATFVIIIVFFVAALFSGVLSQVFAEAVRYKEENDLTI